MATDKCRMKRTMRHGMLARPAKPSQAKPRDASGASVGRGYEQPELQTA